MASDLSSTHGAFLVSFFFKSVLYGCGMLQAYLYFHWYPKDHWGVKAMVASLITLETLQAAYVFALTYRNFVENFGNPEALFVISWLASISILTGFLSAFVVQIYFAFVIYMVDNKKKIAALTTVALALMQIATGIAEVTVTQQSAHDSFWKVIPETLITLQGSSTALCDIVITILLVRTLDKKKRKIKSTNSMLNTLIFYTINRGILLSLFAILSLILFWSTPGTLYYFIAFLPSGNLYMNTALATLDYFILHQVREHSKFFCTG
ncbi:hypothetical protein BDQ17DRAFT_1355051 [Cyathus striatus]|nr:hypothetical protein BDQ17DRAFT_1355051 [Cyathus striatus]